MEIRDSARKHGVSDADILHAVRRYTRRRSQGEGIWIYVGPTRSGHHLLEVAIVEDERGPRIIHAMKARAKFLQ